MILQVTNVRVMGVEEALIASGYPHKEAFEPFMAEVTESDWKRGKRLGQADIGSGHDSFLKGIVVGMDVQAPQYWWLQFQRYHFADIVSSQSKMHKLKRMRLINACSEYVDPSIVKRAQEIIDDYNHCPTQFNFQRMVASVPSGLMLGARVVSNYLQFKTMEEQREKHPLKEWEIFLEAVEGLPHYKELVWGI